MREKGITSHISVSVSSNLYLVNKVSKEAMEKAAISIGMLVSDNARDMCPVKTGLLHNSITYAIGGQAPEITEYTSDDGTESGKYTGTAPTDTEGAVTVYIGTNVKYAPYVELGHKQEPGRFVWAIKKRLKRSWVPGKPFLRPALEGYRKEIEQIVLDCLQNAEG